MKMGGCEKVVSPGFVDLSCAQPPASFAGVRWHLQPLALHCSLGCFTAWPYFLFFCFVFTLRTLNLFIRFLLLFLLLLLLLLVLLL